AAVRKQLIARLWKSTGELAGTVDLHAQELVLRRALQSDHVQVLVALDRAIEELHLESRLALVIEDALAGVAHLDQRLALVVGRHQLAGLRRHLELEQARTWFSR